MIEDPMEFPTNQPPAETGAALPFPFNQQTFCPYEPFEKQIEKVRVLVVDSLLRDEDLSDVARTDWGKAASLEIKRERRIATMAIENIVSNINRLVKDPTPPKVTPLASIAIASRQFQPHAIVLSGTLRDFDYYNPAVLETFADFIRSNKIPVLAICGGHQLVGLSFGARVITLDRLEQHEQRVNRPLEYQYRFIRITEPSDPIFSGINSATAGAAETPARVLRVWQNHGLQLDRVPEGFDLLATSYMCRNQMMVKRADGQLIYTVQFHLEKSFEDWNKSRTRWDHQNKSLHGRILFENFLQLALAHSS